MTMVRIGGICQWCPDWEEQENEPEEITGYRDQPQDMPFSSCIAMPSMDENEKIVIATLGLGQFPAGFYTTQLMMLSNGIGPSQYLLATICIEVYVLFELQPMLGAGEQLQPLYPEKNLKMQQTKITELSHVTESTRNNRIWSVPLNSLMDHPCHAVAGSNLTMVKFILCQLENANTLFEAPLSLYHSTLAPCPVDHVDRPSILIQLAAVHSAQFEEEGDEIESTQAEAFLHEAIELSSADSHKN
ncbi:hypothetical protein HD554DRAFT_2037140 [Boletus coccyginus]|nr:hypothetical protein HD554DRAFT_2037140 [Boletus coccyginus]